MKKRLDWRSSFTRKFKAHHWDTIDSVAGQIIEEGVRHSQITVWLKPRGFSWILTEAVLREVVKRRREMKKAAEGDGWTVENFDWLVEQHGAICQFCGSPLYLGWHDAPSFKQDGTKVSISSEDSMKMAWVILDIPTGRGGNYERENLRLGCSLCSYRKHDRTGQEFIDWLKQKGEAK